MDRRRLGLLAVAALAVVLVVGVLVRSATDDESPRPTPPSPSASGTAPPRGTGGSLSSLTSPENEALSRCRPGADALADCGKAPAFSGTTRWFNTPGGRAEPPATQRGKVVLVSFLSYPCASCVRHQPYVNAWYDAYRGAGLQVIGVESPEHDFEKRPANVAAGLAGLDVQHPVVMDPRLETWTAYRNRYWPSSFLLDARGAVRAVQLGEGGYERTERQIRTLLRAARPDVELPSPVSGDVDAPPLPPTSTTPGVRLGWTHADTYAGAPSRPVAGRSEDYRLGADQPTGSWGLGGTWTADTAAVTAEGESRLRVRARSSRVDAVVGGTGTITVSTEEGSRTVEVSGAPGLVGLLRADEARERTVTLEVSAGLRVYAVTYA
ncbi:hypothetical protein GCM10011519_05260 [Marmoricola endophyticus]|uniref:Thioredoxin domain-containing protein n=1 Tax=Marmoricola endophyticus TaxID=2040280 RepID=A0A917BB18_9ACTN|nr:redoxin domain-containing protein [Marmoricola endophyticus]GGF34760.1 hypothetical protein GCM10011519_05260 [Marmoricola endophyticus]